MTRRHELALHPYYADKQESLRDLVGARAIHLGTDSVTLDGIEYPIVDDVVVMLSRDRWPEALARRAGGRPTLPSLKTAGADGPGDVEFAEDIQFTFGAEWTTFDRMLPDHERWFRAYFDLVDLTSLRDKRLCDLGCGMGRWSYFASAYCREIVLVDFSEAIFVARHTLRERPNAIFVMADIRSLPFRHDFADLIFSLGVLHHLPTPALEAVVQLRRYAPQLLIYLYYALDNRPAIHRLLLAGVTAVRSGLARVRNQQARMLLTVALAAGVYRPLVALGTVLHALPGPARRLARHVPLYDAYREMSWEATKQDVYDRFFTRIEQRVRASDIRTLEAHFREVVISGELPYWHFLCRR